MSNRQPDVERDVLVRHLHGGATTADRWAVFVGQDKRMEMDNPQHALMFARLLADLQQRPVWVCHDDNIEPLDPRSLLGCSCC
jgi:hypothetical protein